MSHISYGDVVRVFVNCCAAIIVHKKTENVNVL